MKLTEYKGYSIEISKAGDFSKVKEVSAEEKEIKRLRKELAETKLERDILKKAVSIFSKSDS